MPSAEITVNLPRFASPSRLLEGANLQDPGACAEITLFERFNGGLENDRRHTTQS